MLVTSPWANGHRLRGPTACTAPPAPQRKRCRCQRAPAPGPSASVPGRCRARLRQGLFYTRLPVHEGGPGARLVERMT
jgi:hypothetical protein